MIQTRLQTAQTIHRGMNQPNQEGLNKTKLQGDVKMQNKYLILVAAVALVLVIAGCAKVEPQQPTQPVDIQAATDTNLGEVVSGIAEADILTEEVQVEEVDINPDELSGLDF